MNTKAWVGLGLVPGGVAGCCGGVAGGVTSTLCARCAARLAWDCFIHNLLAGWWGVISLFVNLVALRAPSWRG